MIRFITFENWKSFRSATLQIEPVTILLGASGSGKSNAIEGLSFLARTAQGKNIRETFDGNEAQPAVRGGIERATFKSADQFTIKALVECNDTGHSYLYRVSFEPKSYLVSAEHLECTTCSPDAPDDERILIDVNIDSDTTILPDESQLKGLSGRIDKMVNLSGLYTLLGRLDERLPDAVQPVTNALQHIFTLNPVPSAMRIPVSVFAENLCCSGANTAESIARLHPEHQQVVENVLSLCVSRLTDEKMRRMYVRKVGKGQSQAMLFAKEQWIAAHPPELVDVRTMSDGMLRFIAMVTALLTQPEGSVIVIENVDCGISTTRACSQIHMLREIASRRRMYLLLTTHNAALLSELETEGEVCIQVVHRDPSTGESKITGVADSTQAAALLETPAPDREAARNAIRRGMAHERGRE